MRKLLTAGMLALILAGTCTPAARGEMSWEKYWDEHPAQQKWTKPVRWTFWHTGGRQLVKYVIKPGFGVYTAWGEFSDQSGMTKANNATASVAQVGALVLLGVGAMKK